MGLAVCLHLRRQRLIGEGFWPLVWCRGCMLWSLTLHAVPCGLVCVLWRPGNAQFVRFTRETPDLVDKHLFTMREVDLVWARSKPVGQRRMDFDSFMDALTRIAWAKYPDACTCATGVVWWPVETAAYVPGLPLLASSTQRCIRPAAFPPHHALAVCAWQ